MKHVVAFLLGLALVGCAGGNQFLPPGGGLYGRSVEVVDDEKCRELGFEPKTEAYANCRLKLEEIRAIKHAAASRQAASSRAQQSSEGVSFMCKDAIARGDSGGVRTFC